ncbi:MAG TPA: HIG1 domain-containing protein [Allosphingosinicella sp.]|nr:HIG1 domain-containing protein [Allosphingosinicella sp.]
MKPILIALLVLAALATLFILGRGLVGMMQGNITPQRSQALMQKRILFQGIAILLAIALLVVAGS